jgi:hypothetical protein
MRVTIADIDAAIARKGEQDGYARISIQHYIDSLRAFFRYVEQSGRRPGLAAAAHLPAGGLSDPKSTLSATQQRLTVRSRQ